MIAKILPFFLDHVIYWYPGFFIKKRRFFSLKFVDIKCCFIFLFLQCAVIPSGITELSHMR